MTLLCLLVVYYVIWSLLFLRSDIVSPAQKQNHVTIVIVSMTLVQGRKCNFFQGGVRTKDRFFSPGTDFAARANYILLRSYRINSNAVIFQFLLF